MKPSTEILSKAYKTTYEKNGMSLFEGEKENSNKEITLSSISFGMSSVYVSEVILSILEYLDKIEEGKEIVEKMHMNIFSEKGDKTK